jgi:hypothetical protein
VRQTELRGMRRGTKPRRPRANDGNPVGIRH